ncbi:hypothetical protein FACS189492_0370 [Clostridia bacterium]|nr:hypothetical protein FACS189492_0370 [Clostridia bacterium]
MSDNILTVLQTAKYLQITEKTVRELIKNKELLASKVGRAWRIRNSDIDKYLAAHTNGKKGAK